MKHYFKIVVLLIISFIPFNTYAYTLTCEGTSYQIDDTFSCKISGELGVYDKLSGTITSSEFLSCNRVALSPGLNVLNSSLDNFFDLTGTASTNDLITLSCKVIKNPLETTNATVAIEDFTYHLKDSGVDEAKEILRSDYIKIEPKNEEELTDNKPRDISDPSVRPRRLTSKELNVTFSQFITEYSVEVLYDVEEVNFDYELNDPTSTLRIEGNTKLQVGNNVIDIYITKADGSKTACYTFNVERLARGEEIYYPESDSTLKSMLVPGYAIGFDPNIFEYKIHLTRDVSSININTIPNYEKAIVSISRTDNLKNGDIIAVEVTSADETSKTTYRIKITKDAPKKDYSGIIFMTLLGCGLIGTIIMFIVTSQKRKNDPLLNIKNDKRKINKGKKFDSSVVPTSQTNENNSSETTEQEKNNSINLASENIATPIQTEKIVDPSFNQVSSVATTVDLTTNVAPTPIKSETQLNENYPNNDVVNQLNTQTTPITNYSNNQNLEIPENQITSVNQVTQNVSQPNQQNPYSSETSSQNLENLNQTNESLYGNNQNQ